MQFKTKMILSITLLMFLSLSLFSFISYNDTKKNSIIQVESSIQLAAHTLTDYIDLWIESKKNVIDVTAQTLSHVESLSDAEMIHHLQILTKSIKGVDSYIGLEDGRMIYGSGAKPSAGFDPRTRPWYISAKETKKAGATDAFISLSTKKHVVAIMAPIYNQNKLTQIAS